MVKKNDIDPYISQKMSEYSRSRKKYYTPMKDPEYARKLAKLSVEARRKKAENKDVQSEEQILPDGQSR